MGVHKPTVIYGMRRLTDDGYVRTISEDLVQVVMPQAGRDMTWPPQVLELTRTDARLLAKRINHCLDDTRTKGSK